MAGNNQNKNRSWNTGLPMQGLIHPERAPDMINVEFNNTTTKLMKQVVESKDGKPTEIRYVGTPVGPDGRRCRFSMSIETNGYVRGSAAMNFIAAGGWGRNTVKPNEEAKRESRTKFVQGFIFSAMMHQGADNSSEMKTVIERETGLKVVEGEITQEDRNLYGLLGVKAYLVSLVASRGLRFEVDIKSYIGKSVQPSYASVISGEWDEESDEVALTSALTEAHVQLLVKAGLKFRMERKRYRAKTQTA